MSIFQPAMSRQPPGGTILIRLALALPLLLAVLPAQAQMEPQIGQEPLHPRGGSPSKNPPRTVKLSPKARVTPLAAPDPVIPIGAIRPFIEHAYVLSAKEIEQAPYVVAFPDRRVLGGAGDRVYVRGLGLGAQKRYRLVRPGGPYRDPASGEVLGYQAQQVAEATLERPGDPAVLRIDSMSQEIATGDRLVPTTGNEPLLTFRPRPGPTGRQAQILAVLNGVSQIGSLNVVVIDLGTDQGVEPGHLFDIHNGGEQIRDKVRAQADDWDWKDQKFWSEESWYGDFRTDRWISDEPDPNTPLPLHRGASPLGEDFLLPLERAGTLMVFRAFPRLSFALVMEATRPMHIQDRVLAPRN
ncbi:MAG: LysM domain-containing protein [Chromatiaceae bacterium]